MKCDDCKFSFDDEAGPEDEIQCRRFPPVLHPPYGSEPPFCYFVTTERFDWCGEFKPKEAA